MTKENFIYVGIDLHKETHTAVIIQKIKYIVYTMKH